jgi:hypothetical protein
MAPFCEQIKAGAPRVVIECSWKNKRPDAVTTVTPEMNVFKNPRRVSNRVYYLRTNLMRTRAAPGGSL